MLKGSYTNDTEDFDVFFFSSQDSYLYVALEWLKWAG